MERMVEVVFCTGGITIGQRIKYQVTTSNQTYALLCQKNLAVGQVRNFTVLSNCANAYQLYRNLGTGLRVNAQITGVFGEKSSTTCNHKVSEPLEVEVI